MRLLSQKRWLLFYSSSDSIKSRVTEEENPFPQRFRFWPTAGFASWTDDDALSDSNKVDTTSADSVVGTALATGGEEEDADMHANKNPDEDDDDDDADADDDDEDEDDDDEDDDNDTSVGSELGLVEQTKTQSSLLSLSSFLTSVKSITSAVAVKLADFNTALPSEWNDLA